MTQTPTDRNQALRDALENVKSAILQAEPYIIFDTLWMPTEVAPAETVVDYIDAILAMHREDRMLNTWALLDEAAADPSLTDAAFRLLVRGRWATVTPEDEDWARDVIAALSTGPRSEGGK